MQIVSVKDAYGDATEVEADSAYVYLYVTDEYRADDDKGCAALNPKKARKVAKALKRAAKEIEALNASKADRRSEREHA